MPLLFADAFCGKAQRRAGCQQGSARCIVAHCTDQEGRETRPRNAEHALRNVACHSPRHLLADTADGVSENNACNRSALLQSSPPITVDTIGAETLNGL